MTREQWLEAAVVFARPWFNKAGFTLPAVKVSCGWPSRKALSKVRALGECWAAEASEDNVHQIFVSPYLDDVPAVLATLVHELLHAAVGCEHGHKAPFKRAMKKVGLTGKANATAADENLLGQIQGWSGLLGAYPNAALDPLRVDKLRKKQTTRMLKCTCPECGYTVRLARKWLDEVGAPHCPKHGETKPELPEEASDE
jgi:hypothetical protein